MRPLSLAAPNLSALILRLALPTVAGLSINAVHQVADAFFVSHVSAEAMAGISLSVPLFVLFGAIGQGLGIAASTEIGRALGRGNAAAAAKVARLAMLVAAFAGLVGGAILSGFAEELLSLLGASGDVLKQATLYTRLLGLAIILPLLQVVCDFVAIGEGNSRFSMYTLLGCFSANIVLDPILIFGLDLGVVGAALATMIAQIGALLAYGIYFRRVVHGLAPFRVRLGLREVRTVLRPLVSIGVPAGLRTVLSAISLAILFGFAARLAEETEVAGLGVAMRLILLAVLPLHGFCLGSQPVLSFAYGQGNEARLRAAFLRICGFCTLFAVICTAVILLFSKTIMHAFGATGDVTVTSVHLLQILSIEVALTGLYLPILAMLQATDQARRAAIIGLAPHGYLLIPLALVLPLKTGFEGIALAPVIATALTAALALPFALKRPAISLAMEHGQ